jgi:hypothetical protein
LRIASLVQDDGSYALEEQPDCIELRRRAADGRRSEPAKICDAELLARDYRASDSKQNGWAECKGGVLGDRDAYDESSDAGAATEPARDTPAANDAPSKPDTSSARSAEPTPTDSGCNVLVAARSDLPRAFWCGLGCTWLLGAARRRKARGRDAAPVR